jgi:hypothetical protein
VRQAQFKLVSSRLTSLCCGLPQHLAVDGRACVKLAMPETGLEDNFTRAYYNCSGRVILSGSSEEQMVRMHCAQTGKPGPGSHAIMFYRYVYDHACWAPCVGGRGESRVPRHGGEGGCTAWSACRSYRR